MKLNVLKYLIVVFLVICSCSSESSGTDVPSNPPDDGGETPDSPVLPEVRTLELGELMIAYVQFQGQLLSVGDSPVTEIGFVVGTEEGATIASNFSRHPLADLESGEFSLIVYDIPPSVDYFVRAYAISADGVGYGSDVMFRTLDENVFDGNVYLDTQEKVVEFGEMDITTITGSLTVTGTVNDISPLLGLEFVGSFVDILFMSELKNLTGLDNLVVTGNKDGQRFRIVGNTGLESLQGLNSLKFAAGGLFIDNNDLLTDLRGLDGLIAVEGLDLPNQIRISGCDNLTSLAGLENLKTIEYGITLEVLPLLTDISVLSNLESIGSKLRVAQCHSLTDLDGLQKITELDEISIYDNDGLTSLKGLENLVSLNSIIIGFNSSLADLSELNNISSLEILDISGNSTLSNLTGLENLTFVSIATVSENQNLISFEGLDKLEEVNRFVILLNPSLQNFNGLESLAKVTNGDDGQSVFLANSNLELSSFMGLENLNAIEGDLTIANNTILSDFCALTSFFQAGGPGGEIYIEDNQFNPTADDIGNGICTE